MDRWISEFPGAITICDDNGIILYMNEKAGLTFQKEGGKSLIGKNLLNCHPEPARSKLADMLKHQKAHAYTIEKKGVKKLIYQTPWYENGLYKGFVELSLELPADMPHFVRAEY